jgi:hypothetical protein
VWLNATEPAAALGWMTMVAGTMPDVGLTMEALLMATHKRLMMIWRQGASAPWTNLLGSVDGLGYAVYLYAVDGSAEEALLWVEGADTPRISDEPGEIFTLTLARDVGARLTTPSPWLYIVHTDIPADVIADYNAWHDEEHLPRLVGVPGVKRARRFVADDKQSPRYLTAYDLSIRDAFESPEGLRARRTPWTERMRSLFKNTRRKMCALKG